MPTKNTLNHAHGIINGHWEPTQRGPKILTLAREGIAKLLRVRDSGDNQRATNAKQGPTQH